MRKFYIIIGALLGILISAQGQQIPLLSNNLDNQMFFNPALTGIHKYAEIRGVYRSKWQGVEDAPTSQFIGFRKGLDSLPIGLGFMGYNDAAGQILNTGGALMVSYHKFFSETVSLSAGLASGISRWRLDQSAVRIQDVNDSSIGDNGNSEFFVNLGLNLQIGGLSIGVSAPQLLEAETVFQTEGNDIINNIKRHFKANLAYRYQLNESLYLVPNFHARIFETAPFQFDAGLRLGYKNVWLAGMYRLEDAIGGQIGFDLGNTLGIYYAYDATSSELNQVSNGSHEVGLALYIGKNKDSDGDGIPDKEDECPNEPGPAENNGCPEKDRDGDGIPDKEDECPDDPGLEKYFGCPDTDGDGLIDKIDQCPKKPGKPEFFGCPDSDGDGIPDNKDECPDVAGLEEHRGCPDSDGDGLSDNVDSCPLQYGPKENGGCPWLDSDGDGILDNVDRCPTIPGPESNGGCPLQAMPDSDGDGVVDSLDDCPGTAGPPDNGGCPRISDQDKQTIYLALVNLEFEFDKAIIKQNSLPYLERLAELMVRKYDWKLRIAGHTDNVGPDDYNMRLSRDRSYSVRNYLLSRGMASHQFIIEYYGETRPIDTNETEEGKQRNRRVEMEFIFD